MASPRRHVSRGRESPRVSRDDVRPPRRPDAVPKDAVKQLFLEDGDEYSTLAVAQVGAFLDVGATFSKEEDLLPSAQKLLKAMRRERPREDRKKPLEPPFSSLDVDLEDVRRWHSRESILREDAWGSSHTPAPAKASVHDVRPPPPPSVRAADRDRAHVGARERADVPQRPRRGAHDT